MNPDERAEIRAEHTRCGDADAGLYCGECVYGGEPDTWPCSIIRLLDALEVAEGERDGELAARESEQEATQRLVASHHRWTSDYERLRAAFVRHRTATHEVKPMYCVTCRESDAALGIGETTP